MAKKIVIEVDFGLNAVEKRNINVYIDEKMEASYMDIPYEDISAIVKEFREKYPDAELEVLGVGQDCTGKFHQWVMDF